jgi:hypothetical protein
MSVLVSRALPLVLATSALALGCADGERDPAPDARGGGAGDAGRGFDAGEVDAALDAARLHVDAGRDAGMTSCPSGEHVCGTRCVRDLTNDPANGCRLGCGEPCAAPDMGVATCGMDGRCAWECEPPFRRMGDACVCAPTTCDALAYECGTADDGCGRRLDCGSCMGGATCLEGRCGCAADELEPNDSNTSPAMRSGLNDADDPPDVILTANIDEPRDEDWFSFPITDGTDGGNPRITVTLGEIPAGSDYALSAFYVCGDRTDDSTCARGAPDNFVGRGCAGSTSGSAPETVELATDCSRGLDSDDSGTLLVRVTAPTWSLTCGPYRVTVRVR